jgi:hypothetical protein
MKAKLQFGAWLLAAGIGATIALPANAQNRPPKPRQEQRQERRQERPQAQRNERSHGNANRPPVRQQSITPNTNRPPERARNQQNLNRPPSAYTPPARDFNSLNRQQQQKAIENNRDFQRRTPAERQRIKQGLENWNRLTPQQQSHIKNEVMPKWRQLPPDRQRAIGSRLNVLQNMPESARNRHLEDPNFTRGMSEEDKATLRDLAHLHVGGAPDEPHE